MNRSNGTPGIVAEIDGFLCLPCTVPVPIFFATNAKGRLWQESAFICGTTHFVYVIAPPLLVCINPASPRTIKRKMAGRERPPLFCRSSGKQGRGFVAEFVAYPAPPLGGSLPSKLSLREGRPCIRVMIQVAKIKILVEI